MSMLLIFSSKFYFPLLFGKKKVKREVRHSTFPNKYFYYKEKVSSPFVILFSEEKTVILVTKSKFRYRNTDVYFKRQATRD